MSTPDRKPVTQALVELLQKATDCPWAAVEAPDRMEAKPWGVVWSIPGGGFDYGAPLTAPDDTAQMVYQLDSVGLKESQAEWLADVARRSVLARTPRGAFQVAFPRIPAWAVIDRRPSGGPGGILPEGPPKARVYTVSERFVICVSPA